LAYYNEAIRLYEKHKHAAGFSGPVREAALQFAQLAVSAAVDAAKATMDNPDLTPQKTYALKMVTLDPLQAAEMYRKFGTFSVKALHEELVKLKPDKRLKQRQIIFGELDQLIPAGARHGAVESELLLVKWRLYESMYHWDDKKNDIYVKDEMVRKKLLEQFERNAEVAPNDYIKVWSLLFMTEIDNSSDDKKTALNRYKKGLALAEQLAQLHGGIGNIRNDRPFDKGKNPSYYDDWNELYRYYQGATYLAKDLARDPAFKGQRRELLQYALTCVDNAISGGPPPDVKSSLETLKEKLEKEMMK
jgi:hypothetical protein